MYLDYVLSGNGGVGGRGFFRDEQPGYVVARKQVSPGQWQYWWIHVTSKNSSKQANQQPQVDFYGSSLGSPLATAPQVARATALAYPNPSTDNWQLLPAGSGPYRLLDYTGRVVSEGQLAAGPNLIRGQYLAPGLYWLESMENGRAYPAATQQILTRSLLLAKQR